MSDTEQPGIAKKPGWQEWVVDHFPPGQFGRYLVVGLVNTAFGVRNLRGSDRTPHAAHSLCLYVSLRTLQYSEHQLLLLYIQAVHF